MLIKHFRETCVGTISVGNYPNQILFSTFVANLRKKKQQNETGKKNGNKKKHLSKARVAFDFFFVCC